MACLPGEAIRVPPPQKELATGFWPMSDPSSRPGAGPPAGMLRSSLLVGKRTVRKQESRNKLKRWDQATSGSGRSAGTKCIAETRGRAGTSGPAGIRFAGAKGCSKSPLPPCLARPLHRWAVRVLQLIQSREGPEP
jgi:hypothetical protein